MFLVAYVSTIDCCSSPARTDVRLEYELAEHSCCPIVSDFVSRSSFSLKFDLPISWLRHLL